MKDSFFFFFLQQLDCKCSYAKKMKCLLCYTFVVSPQHLICTDGCIYKKKKTNKHSSIAFYSTETTE